MTDANWRDVVGRLRQWEKDAQWDGPLDQAWDSWRSYIAGGGGGSWPRDAFQSITFSMALNGKEAAALIERQAGEIARLREALQDFASYGCPICGGDCSSANPPVYRCPPQLARAALAATEEKSC